jgi:hypothetical protein
MLFFDGGHPVDVIIRQTMPLERYNARILDDPLQEKRN